MLSRSTAFPIKWKQRTRWLTSRHVTHPQLHLDTYYANDNVDWLQEITPEMTRQHLEWRTPDGTTILKTAKIIHVRSHAELDVAEIQLEKSFHDKTPGFQLFEHSNDSAVDMENKELHFFGHNLNVVVDEETGDDLGNMVPHVEKGVSRVVSGFRLVCETEEPLHMGMCGGPCLYNDRIVGMTEGILPGRSEELGPEDQPKRVADAYPRHAVVMGNSALVQFLNQEEEAVVVEDVGRRKR